MEKLSRSVGIHDGTFHADEVTACALLLLFNLVDYKKIFRTRDPQKLSTCEYVCDVGGEYDPSLKLFDHHQVEYEGELSSAGMILLYLRNTKVLSQEEFQFFNEALVKGIDAHDNGRVPQELGFCSFSHVIANFNPVSYEASDEELQDAFLKALDFTLGHLTRLWDRHHYNLRCNDLVKETMEKYKTCLLFDRAIPWIDSFFSLNGEKHSALFVIMPSGTQWKLRGIPPDGQHRMQVRQPLPKQWAGLLGEELKKVTGIKGAVFCHKGRFTSVWETKEEAIQALKWVLKLYELEDKDHL